MTEITWLDPEKPSFPPSNTALEQPPGLLAAGGNLEINTLKSAYYQGIFPWYSEGEPPLWWSPNPRAVLFPSDLYINRTTEKLIRKCTYRFTSNTCFERVIQHCAHSRQEETWILEEMTDAYCELHLAGFAHSLEVWQDENLVGGLYGVQVGNIFCGESMFHLEQNSSKLAFICLARTLFAHSFEMIDCQLQNPFLSSLGVKEVSRNEFESTLLNCRDKNTDWPINWAL